MSHDYADEVRRKFFHMFSLLYAALYAVGGRRLSLEVLGGAFVLVGVLEAVRLHNPKVNAFVIGLFRGIHREKESDKPSGILWTLGGAFLTILFIPSRDVVLASLFYLALGDAAAALVGRKWGHIRLGAKSLEGSLACFLACWAAGAWWLESPGAFPEAALGAFAATVAEALDLPPDDNLWIPLVPAAAITAARYFSI